MEKELTSAINWGFLENLSEGVIVATTGGEPIFANEAAHGLLALNQTRPSLTAVFHVFNSHPLWSVLLDAPARLQVALDDGRHLQCASTIHTINEQNLVQITIHPLPPSVTTSSAGAFSLDPLVQLGALDALTQISSEKEFGKQLQLLVDGLQSTGWNRVILSLRDADFMPTEIITAGFREREKVHLRENMLPPQVWTDLFETPATQLYREGNCYFVPGDSEWTQNYLGRMLPDEHASGHAADSWHPLDLLCIPLMNRQQKRIGLLGVDSPVNGRRPDPITLQMVELFAQFAAATIENAELYQEAVNNNREFEILLNASNAFSSTLEKDTILLLLGEHILQLVNIDGYSIYRWDDLENQLYVLRDYTHGGLAQLRPAGTAVPLTKSTAAQLVLGEQESLLLPPTADSFPRPSWLPERQEIYSAAIPLVLSGNTYGLIHIIAFDGTILEETALPILTTLANQAGSALETALIFEDTYERERFYGALGNVSLALNFTLDRDTVLNLICNESVRIFDVQGAYIWQRQGDNFIGSAARGPGEVGFIDAVVPIRNENSFVAQIARSSEATYINHVTANPILQIQLPHAEQIQAVLGVPLEQEGKLIGILVLVDTQNPNRFTGKDITRATTMGVQVSIAIRNAQLFSELRRFNEELDTRVAQRTAALHEESNRVKILLSITSELSASLDQDRVLNKALDLVNEMVNATDGVILLLNPDSQEYMFRASLAAGKPLPQKGIPSGLKQNEGLAGWMMENRTAVIVHDTETDPRWVPLPNSSKYRSVLGVPLISSAEVIGVLMMFHTLPNAFTDQQLDLVEAATIQVANAINNASLYQLIFEQAERLGSMLRTETIQNANLQAILESIADGVVVADNNHVISIANIPAGNILDIPRQQLIGKSINELLGVYGHFGESWLETIEDWESNSDHIQQGTYLADQLTIEDNFISIHLSPVLSDGQFFGTVSIFRDITKEVEVDRLKSEFVSTVSHELRTPMTSIKGYADLMLMGAAGSMSEPQGKYLSVIKNNADRLHMLVNDLLNISRIETGKTTLDLRPLDIPQIIEQVMQHLQGRIHNEGKPLQVSTKIEPSLPLVNADQSRVSQILTNLLDNAFNYTPANGKVRIEVNALNDSVYIHISDSGIGISQENLDKIFDRFFRAEDEIVQQIPGTGLGLSIVRSLIEMHGGFLHVESKMGQGSTFSFNLPVVVEDSDPT